MCNAFYIVSTSRSGSTLLDLLLGNHSRITSVGEGKRIDEWLEREDFCTCDARVSQCGFWRRIDQELAADGLSLRSLKTQVRRGKRHFGLMPLPLELALIPATPASLGWLAGLSFVRHGAEAAQNHWRLLDAVRKSTGNSIVVDSSKWAEHGKLLYLVRPESFRMIYLVRDGRGVAYSTVKRAGIPMKEGATGWLANNVKAILLQRNIPREKRLLLRHEDICREPEKHLRKISDFVGLPFDHRVLILNKHMPHNVGGSPHRFEESETTILLDDRWRQELTPRQLADFERVAGFLNRRFGYAPWRHE